MLVGFFVMTGKITIEQNNYSHINTTAYKPLTSYMHNTTLPYHYHLWGVAACAGYHLVLMSYCNTTESIHKKTHIHQ